MFHNTHAYLASKLYKSENILLLTGSILPDIAITKIITWDKGLHGEENFESFFQFVGKNYPDFFNLNKGIFAHNIVDDLTHRAYMGGTGYAYQNNRELINLLVKYYEITPERAEILAHNYIESAVEINLLKEHPNIQEKLIDALKGINTKKLAKILGGYFKIDNENFLEALDNFFSLIKKYNFKREENWIIFWGEFGSLLELKKIEKEKRAKLIDLSLGIVKNTYKDFLEYSQKEGLKKIL